jgi:hypothetical protein
MPVESEPLLDCPEVAADFKMFCDNARLSCYLNPGSAVSKKAFQDRQITIVLSGSWSESRDHPNTRDYDARMARRSKMSGGYQPRIPDRAF